MCNCLIEVRYKCINKVLEIYMQLGNEGLKTFQQVLCLPEEAKEKLREQIQLFPHRKSHYSHTDNKKKYLRRNLGNH